MIAVPFDTELLFSVTSPPRARPQTPPPGWFGTGFGGAETNALPCWPRKIVFMLPMAPAIAPETAAAGAATVLRLLTPLNGVAVETKLQFGVTPVCGAGGTCAKALFPPGSASAKTTPAAKTAPPDRRDLMKVFIRKSPKQKRNQNAKGTAKKPRTAGARPKAGGPI